MLFTLIFGIRWIKDRYTEKEMKYFCKYVLEDKNSKMQEITNKLYQQMDTIKELEPILQQNWIYSEDSCRKTLWKICEIIFASRPVHTAYILVVITFGKKIEQSLIQRGNEHWYSHDLMLDMLVEVLIEHKKREQFS